MTEFSTGIRAGGNPNGITAGPDGNLWFTETNGQHLAGERIGRITPAGVVTEFSTGIASNSVPGYIASGPDGNLWFTEEEGGRIGRITPTGLVTEFSNGISSQSVPYGIAAGPDGNVWFAEFAGHRIGRITCGLTPPIVASQPVSVTVPVGSATQFTSTATGIPTPSVQWETSTNGSTWTSVPGGTQTTLHVTAPPVVTTVYYRAVFTNSQGTATSNPATLTTQAAPPEVVSHPVSVTVPVGSATQFTSTATGIPTPNVQWETSTNGSTWTSVPGGTQTTLHVTAPPVVTTVYYRAVFTNSQGTATSNPATLTTTPTVPASPPAPVLTPGVATLTASWAPNGDGASPITGFLVEYRAQGASAWAPTLFGAGTRSTTWTLVGGGYEVRVAAVNAVGTGPYSPVSAATVGAVTQQARLSLAVVRPYRDGFQDATTVSATSNVTSSGDIRVLNGRGLVVKSWPLATGTSWARAWAGLDSRGRRVPFGTYRFVVRLQAYGQTSVVATLPVVVAASQVATPALSMNRGTLYPIRDGYADTVAIRVRASLPAAGTLSIRRGSTEIWRTTLRRGTSWTIGWNGRTRSGATAPAGTYTVIALVRGGEGTVKARAGRLAVSSKRLTRVTGSATYLAEAARHNCGGYGYHSCEVTTWLIGGRLVPVTRYYNNGEGDHIWAAHFLPLPAGTRQWRLHVTARTFDARYVLGYCRGDATYADECTGGGGGIFATNTDAVFTGPWTSIGVTDRYADFYVGSLDWGSIYIYTFTIDYVYTALR